MNELRLLKQTPDIKIPFVDACIEIGLYDSSDIGLVYELCSQLEKEYNAYFLINQDRKTKFYEKLLYNAGCEKTSITNLAENYSIKKEKGFNEKYIDKIINDMIDEDDKNALVTEDFAAFMDFFELDINDGTNYVINKFRKHFEIIIYNEIDDLGNLLIKPEISLEVKKIKKNPNINRIKKIFYKKKFKDFDYWMKVHNEFKLDMGVSKKSFNYLFSKDGYGKKVEKKELKGIIISAEPNF